MSYEIPFIVGSGLASSFAVVDFIADVDVTDSCLVTFEGEISSKLLVVYLLSFEVAGIFPGSVVEIIVVCVISIEIIDAFIGFLLFRQMRD